MTWRKLLSDIIMNCDLDEQANITTLYREPQVNSVVEKTVTNVSRFGGVLGMKSSPPSIWIESSTIGPKERV